ncbi:S-layer homology domain-containing protein [Brevibacillus sp. NL20B1]|uniref:S-layer homology domain-containing protein n=1 Tax=Brevibacillus sp. NL20B1 TaxID=2829799 RepID=UPI001B904928|nr:S-layer homology domain-containing protein [Brevibacillus sp. NL20B1]MBR8660904.1 S-layer homology domain-containing protein [Brevibacillus sp. NL20B1]
MKPWIIRSGSVVLSAVLLAPAAQAYAAQLLPAEAPVQATPISAPAGNQLTDAASKAKLSKEAALNIAKKLVPQGLELENVSFRSADIWRTFPEWTFIWVKKDQNEIAYSYTVSIHADSGELTGYSHYQQHPSKPAYADRVSYAEAQEAAEQFLARHNPAKAKATRLYTRDLPVPKTPLDSNTSYTFRFVRLVDDVPFPDNSVEITVNAAGTVTGYTLSWSDGVRFEKPQRMLSPEEAAALFKQHAKAKLSYVLPWDARGEERNKPILAYENPFTFYLDAKNGTPLTDSLEPLKPEAETSPTSSKRLSPRHTGSALTQEAAVQLAERTFDLSGYKLRAASYNEKDSNGSRPVWNLEYQTKNANGQSYVYIAMDALNGDVYHFSKNNQLPEPKKDAAKKADANSLKKKAAEVIRSWTPTWADRLYVTETTELKPDAERYEVRFQRLVNGIPAATGSASVSFDAATGEVLTYNTHFGSETYPSQVPKHRSAAEALAAWQKETEVEAVYMLEPLPDDAVAFRAEKAVTLPERKAKLVYRAAVTPLDQPYVYDAVSGDWRSLSTGKPIQLHRPAPADLKGHPAEKALMLMYEYEALSLIDGNIMPERSITRGEMIQMLMLSLNQGRVLPVAAGRKASFSDVASTSKYFAAVEAAVDRGLLDKNSPSLKPDETITREELADMIVRALGYRKLSEHAEMFATKLTDIDQSTHRGAIVIVSTLGIMTPAKGEFQPKGSVSRADAAVAFARFLEKRSELEENRTF